MDYIIPIERAEIEAQKRADEAAWIGNTADAYRWQRQADDLRKRREQGELYQVLF